VGVEDTFGNIVGVLESLSSRSEWHERSELDHSVENVDVVDGILHRLGLGANLLLHIDGEKGIARRSFKEDVGE
jgi:hypothetical protein